MDIILFAKFGVLSETIIYVNHTKNHEFSKFIV